MTTRYEHYYARGKCLTCGTAMWCSTSTDSVACAVGCGAAVLRVGEASTNVGDITDAEHEAAIRVSENVPEGDTIVLVPE